MAEYDETLLAKAAEALYANACEPTGTKARAVLDVVAPLIAAQAWDACVAEIRRCDPGCTDDCDLCVFRGDVLADLQVNPYHEAMKARQTHGNGHESHERPESDHLGHCDATDNSEDA